MEEIELKEIYYRYLVGIFKIDIIDEYTVFYDEVYNHILKDAHKVFDKNLNLIKSIKFNNYIIQKKDQYFEIVFRSCVYKNEKRIIELKKGSPYLKRKLRNLKINKINK